MTTRREQDSMGTVELPADAYYGAQTQRAVENFPISGIRFPSRFIRTLGLIKQCAARVNLELGLLDKELAGAIVQAASEVADGRLDDQFVLDVFQTGSGTSTNMNANEVIAGRANEILTDRRGGRKPVHPNDHVNLGQSSNDVIPTAIHVAALTMIRRRLLPALEELRAALAGKAAEFAGIRKIGRTHLQDAVPVTLGQEFGGYARMVELGIRRVDGCGDSLSELALGGTAVGTGLNTHPEFARRTIALISEETGIDFVEAENHFEAQGAQDAAVETSGALKTVAVGMFKIANDIRWLASGPRFGLREILLPELQPGSSIMPGKVNPVLPEVVVQVAAQVCGADTAVTMGGLTGYFELNTMLPLIAHNLLESIEILGAAAGEFARRCVSGIKANENSPATKLERGLSLATNLVPAIGYDKAAWVAKEAYKTDKTVREVALENNLLPEKQLDELLDL